MARSFLAGDGWTDCGASCSTASRRGDPAGVPATRGSSPIEGRARTEPHPRSSGGGWPGRTDREAVGARTSGADRAPFPPPCRVVGCGDGANGWLLILSGDEVLPHQKLPLAAAHRWLAGAGWRRRGLTDESQRVSSVATAAGHGVGGPSVPTAAARRRFDKHPALCWPALAGVPQLRRRHRRGLVDRGDVDILAGGFPLPRRFYAGHARRRRAPALRSRKFFARHPDPPTRIGGYRECQRTSQRRRPFATWNPARGVGDDWTGHMRARGPYSATW